MDQAKHLSAVINAMKGPKVMGGSAAAAADPSAAALHLVAVLDPLTRLSQRTSQVLTWVAQLLDPAISLFLNPVMDLTDMPLKNYYRWA
jgi:UDP-glucose:glycoprotein glucosyltransferase